MLKTLRLILVFSFVNALSLSAQAQSAQTLKCNVSDLPGKVYSNSNFRIEFLKDNQASYQVKGAGEGFVVSYAAASDSCFVILTDSDVPALKNGRTYTLRADFSLLTEWESGKVLKRTEE